MAYTIQELPDCQHVCSAPVEIGCGVTPVSVVVPLFNEYEGVTLLLERLSELEVALCDKYCFEFVLVDDGSRDGTAEFLEKIVAHYANYRMVRHQANRGLAAAIHTGLIHAESELVVSIDSDGSYDADLVEEMLPLMVPGVDLITASPYHPDGRIEDVPRWRIAISRCASQLYRVAMRRKLHCYTSCFRVYRRSCFVDIVPRESGFVGIAELIWKAESQGLGIVEYPAVLRRRVVGKSKLKVARSTLAHLRLIARIAFDRLVCREPKRKHTS